MLFTSLHATVTCSTLCYAVVCQCWANVTTSGGILGGFGSLPGCFRSIVQHQGQPPGRHRHQGTVSLAERRLDKESIGSVHRDKMWEQTTQRTSWHANEKNQATAQIPTPGIIQWKQSGGTFVWWYERATSVPYQVSTNKESSEKLLYSCCWKQRQRKSYWYEGTVLEISLALTSGMS